MLPAIFQRKQSVLSVRGVYVRRYGGLLQGRGAEHEHVRRATDAAALCGDEFDAGAVWAATT